MTIPQIIISQIQSLDNWALSAYGSKNFYSIDESSKYQYGLVFSINGLNHKPTKKYLRIMEQIQNIENRRFNIENCFL